MIINSILTSVKKNLGIAESYTAFDPDVLMHINTAFSTLDQLGVGPAGGFMIEDADPTWDAFLGDDPRLNNIKTYIYLRVKLLFDPPGTSYLIEAMDKQRQELEWRINALREASQWVDPTAPNDTEDGELVLDGGIP